MGGRFLISIHPGDALTIYRQIVEQVKGAIAGGVLKPGDRLPSHRELAGEVLVAPLTVKKAYDLLEREGLIVMEQGRGTFVADGSAGAGAGAAAERELDARVRGLVRQARLLGWTEEKLIEYLRQMYRSGWKNVDPKGTDVVRI